MMNSAFKPGPEESFDDVSKGLFSELGAITILDLQATTAASLDGGVQSNPGIVH